MNKEIYKNCNPHCLFFPQEVNKSNIIEKYVSEDGVVHRKVKRYCKYDGHQILNWEEICPRYLELNKNKSKKVDK